MNYKKILILGNGFIGSNLYKYFILKTKYNTIITNKKEVDIIDINTINNYFKYNNFDYIIYSIGIKDIKKCENNQDLAYAVNTTGISNIIKNLNTNTKIIYISTDYIFDGKSGNYSENSIPNPKTFYGKSKLLGEEYCLKHENSIVVRTSGVYGRGCLWLSNLIDSLKNKERINCFSDVYNSPTYAINLADMINDLINIDYRGIINLCGNTKINRYDLYTTVASIFNEDTHLLGFGKSSGQFPKDISLDNTLYKKLLNKIPDTVNIGLNKFKNEY